MAHREITSRSSRATISRPSDIATYAKTTTPYEATAGRIIPENANKIQADESQFSEQNKNRPRQLIKNCRGHLFIYGGVMIVLQPTIISPLILYNFKHRFFTFRDRFLLFPSRHEYLMQSIPFGTRKHTQARARACPRAFRQACAL